MDSNLIGQIIIKSEVYMLDSNPSYMDSNHSMSFEVRSQGELHKFESLLKDSNHLRKIEDRTENKEIDSNPSYMDSNHSVSFEVRSQGKLHGFESSDIGFKSNAVKLSKGFESFKFRFESPRQKIKSDSFPTTSFWSITGLFLLQRT